MTTTKQPVREPGYRGSLPTREDRLAKPWLIAVAGIFVLAIVLSIAGIPSRFIAEPTPIPLPSFVAESAEPSGSADASVSTGASASAAPSAEPSAAETSAAPSE